MESALTLLNSREALDKDIVVKMVERVSDSLHESADNLLRSEQPQDTGLEVITARTFIWNKLRYLVKRYKDLHYIAQYRNTGKPKMEGALETWAGVNVRVAVAL